MPKNLEKNKNVIKNEEEKTVYNNYFHNFVNKNTKKIAIILIYIASFYKFINTRCPLRNQ